MDILLVTMFYSPNEPGGTETQTRLLAEQLNELGHNVKVLSFDGSICKNDIEINGIKVLRVASKYSQKYLHVISNRKFIGVKNLLKLIFSYRHHLELKKGMDSLLRNYSPDVINFSGSFFIFNIQWLFSYFAKKFPNVKKILTIHDYIILGRKSTGSNQKQFFFHSWKKFCIKKYVNAIIVPTNHFAERVKADGFKNVEVISNLTPNILEPNYEAPNDKLIITYAGSIEKEKGLDWFANSIIKLSEVCKNCIFQIIGNGDYLNTLMSDLKNCKNVVFFDKMPREKLLLFLKKTDIIVLPSRFNETFGLILLEGYNCGALPLGSKYGAIPELLNYDEELIFGNENELVSKLRLYINSPEKIKEKHKYLKAHFSKYNNINIIERYLKIIKY